MLKYEWLNGSDNYDAVLKVRFDIFCGEQHYPAELEQDKDDLISEHLLVKNENNEIIGCGRLLKISDEEYHLGRIAVYEKYRGKDYGRDIMAELERKAKSYNAEFLSLEAQEHAIPFYEKLNYKANTSVYPDENIIHIGMIKNLQFDNCKFCVFDKSLNAGIMKKQFNCDNVKSVNVRYTTAGFSEPYVNGKKINEYKYTPVWSNFVNRDLSVASYPLFDNMVARWYYLEYDITDLIKSGENIFTLHIGNGWFKQEKNHAEGQPVYGENLGYCYKITITDNNGNTTEINSDGSEICSKSYIVDSNIYMREITDGRLYKDDLFTNLSYNDAEIKTVSMPNTVFEKQKVTGDLIKYELTPELIYEKGNVKLYDLTKDVAGLPIIKFDENSEVGDEAKVIVAEVINDDFSLYFRPTGGDDRKQEDTYINGKNNCPMTNIFTWRAGQYIRIEGNATLEKFCVVNSDIEKTCDFKSNNETLNWLFEAYINTQSNNVHSFVPSDCPHRERLGYTGDGQLCSSAVMTMYDAEFLYRKWMTDIADSQDRYTGHVQHTAPCFGGGGGPGGWGGAIAIVPYNFYKHYGDLSVVKKYYYPIMNYIHYMINHSENHLVTSGEKDGWCLGDWCAPDNCNEIPEPFINTYFLIKAVKIEIEFAGLLDKDTTELEKILKDTLNSFNKAYYNTITHGFIGGIQGADAFGLDLGLGDEKTVEHLVKYYEKLKQFDTGIFATPLVIKILFEKGYPQLAFDLLTNEKEISFYNMKKQGATTLWENWDGCDSHSHPMFGAVCEYLFGYILGIRQTENSVSFNNYTINPSYIKGLKAEGYITTENGKISVKVDNTGDICKYTVTK